MSRHEVSMKSHLLVTFLVSSLLVLVVAVAYRYVGQLPWERKSSAADLASSGSDFLVEGQPARATLEIDPLRSGVNDSVTAVLMLTPLTTSSVDGLANEHDGFLAPALQAGDCAIDTPPGLSKSTKLPFPKAFVWNWTVTCAQEGSKNVQVMLMFSSTESVTDSDEVAFRKVESFTVVGSPIALTVKLLTALGGFGTFVSAVALALEKLGWGLKKASK